LEDAFTMLVHDEAFRFVAAPGEDAPGGDARSDRKVASGVAG
jgi:hypothetical protein